MLRPVYQKLIWLVLLIIAVAIALGASFYTQKNSVNRQTSLFDSGDLAGEIKSDDAVLAQQPNNVNALLDKASSLAQEGSFSFNEKAYGEQALAVANQALAIDPKSDEALRIIGYAHEIMQEYPEAHAAYQQALAINPKNAKVISQDAHAWDLQGDFVKAEAGYRAALAIDATLDEAQFGLGRILLRQGKADEALAQFNLVAQTSQNARRKAEGAYSAGVIENSKQLPEQAEASMRLAVATDPSYALAWVGLGRTVFFRAMLTGASEKSSLLQEATSDFQKAISINPDQTQAYFQLGMMYSSTGQQDMAVKTLTQALAVVPNDITVSAPDKQLLSNQISGALSIAEGKKH